MQTFLPYSSIKKSVSCLDNKRLGKQRVEAFQIFKALTVPDYGWKNHPATLMWKGYESSLLHYMNGCIIEWIERGFNNTMKIVTQSKVIYPKWFGDERLHASHRSNLLRKDYKHYSRFNWVESPNMDYFWPTKNGM